MISVVEAAGGDRIVMDAAIHEDVQLPHLDTFSIAAELSSFTKAARTLRVTQAAVSQRVQAIEKAVGTALFRRLGGQVVLTEAGQRLYSYAQRILDLHREARREVTGRDAPIVGELAVAASSIPGEHLLPALLSAFRKKYPHIQVRADVSDSMKAIDQVERGKVSVGFVGRKTNKPHLEFRHLATDRMVLVVPPRHPLRRRKQVSLGELAEHPFVLREPGSGLRQCFEQSLERAGRSLADLRVALELGSNEAIKEAVLRGAGVAVLSYFAVQKELKVRQLHALQMEGMCCDREMFIVLDRRRVLPASVRLFLTFLDAHPLTEGP
jgi:DNA-binding transcriptional LysR family regulator